MTKAIHLQPSVSSACMSIHVETRSITVSHDDCPDSGGGPHTTISVFTDNDENQPLVVIFAPLGTRIVSADAANKLPYLITRNHGGMQKTYSFANGYGASVIRHPGSYGYASGLWELAVKKHGSVCTDTPITSDVIGHLTEDAAEEILKKIESLPKA